MEAQAVEENPPQQQHQHQLHPVARLSYFLSCASPCFASDVIIPPHLCALYQQHNNNDNNIHNNNINMEELKQIVRVSQRLRLEVTLGKVFFPVGKKSPALLISREEEVSQQQEKQQKQHMSFRLFDLEEGIHKLEVVGDVQTSITIGGHYVEIKKVLIFTVLLPLD